MPIRQLSETVINQIAAGEVIERPASVVKELVENSLDAGARRIEIATTRGGLGQITVTDNGSGIPADELPLAVGRHCTSKLSDDIFDIRSLGFRGEALPSIGSVSRLTIRSRPQGADEAAEIVVENGKIEGPRPSGANYGTVIEVRDLFHSVPARLKFMRSERAENAAVTDVVKRLAMASPQVHFTLSGPDRGRLEYPAAEDSEKALHSRIAQIFGREFSDSAIDVDAERDGVRLYGQVAVPSYNRNNALLQFAYVNGRPVRDKQVAGAIRGAYSDFIPKNRHGVAALFIEIDPAFVDVNVHPAKADVRFRDAGLVRGLIVGAVRQALANEGIKPSSAATADLAKAFVSATAAAQPSPRHYDTRQMPAGVSVSGFAEATQASFEHTNSPSADARASDPEQAPEPLDAPLGAARAQIHENYIVAQTRDGLVIVDQHAAHERIVYEAMKKAIHGKDIPSQMLLIPDIVDLNEDDVDRLMSEAETLSHLGLVIERFGPGAIAVRETPSLLGEIDAAALIRDVCDEIAEHGRTSALAERIDYLAATMACHGSVRSGRRMRAEEMNALLRQMEATPGSGTCNHGRPTFIELKLGDIERLFGRS